MQVSGMELFKRAKSVRLRSHHDKYLSADFDEETVVQDRSGSSKSVNWTVELVEGVDIVLRLKSCYGRYLKASDEEFLLGVTGRKVVQSLPRKLDSSVEWEPIKDGHQLKLKTRYGNYLRANGGLPPWRNSVTHDIPHRHRDWILWEVDVIETRPKSPPKVPGADSLDDLSSSSFQLRTPSQSGDSFEDLQRISEGRLIYYAVADDDSNIDDLAQAPSFQFKGHGLEELTQRLEEKTGLVDIIVCSQNIVNGKLYPLRLSLPPNNATMQIVVVPPASKVANEFLPAPPTSTWHFRRFRDKKRQKIYSCGLYNLLHNAHLNLEGLDGLFEVVQIARRLLGKIMIDLGNTREEAINVAELNSNQESNSTVHSAGKEDTDYSSKSYQEGLVLPVRSMDQDDDDDKETKYHLNII